MRLTPGRSPGESASYDQVTTPSGPTITIERFEKPAGSKYAPNAFDTAPLGSKSDSCGIEMLSFSRNALSANGPSQATPYISTPWPRSSSTTSS